MEKFYFSEVVSLLALIVATISGWSTIKLNKKQNKFIEQQEKLNAIALQKHQAEDELKSKAKLQARISNRGVHDYKLVIYNIGKSKAKNIRLELPTMTEHHYRVDQFKSNFPFESLDSQASTELTLYRVANCPLKNTVILTWDDDSGVNNTDTFYVSF